MKDYFLIQKVINKEKPCALISLENEISNQNLEYEKTGYFYNDKIKYTQYAISLKKLKFNDVVIKDELKKWNDYDKNNNLKYLYEKFEKLSAVKALKNLCEHPRQNKEKENIEVCILQGLLLGYNKCCIKYYIKTRYFNEKEHELDNILSRLNDDEPQAKCYECSKKNKGDKNSLFFSLF